MMFFQRLARSKWWIRGCIITLLLVNLITGSLFFLSKGSRVRYVAVSPKTDRAPVDKFERDLYFATFALWRAAEGGDPQFTCTATAFMKNGGSTYYLLSAGHCVDDGYRYYISEQIGSRFINVRLIKAVLDEKSGIDFSLWEMQSDKAYPIIPLDMKSVPAIGDQVVNANFALGVVEQISHGVVSSRDMENTIRCDDCAGEFIVQLYGAPGSSGSPIVSLKTHKIIGIVVAGWDRWNPGMVVEPITRFPQFAAH